MGTIYHFEPLVLPYPNDIYTSGPNTTYDNFSSNNKANIDTILGSDKKLVTCIAGGPEVTPFYSIRYVINGDCYGGAFISYIYNSEFSVQEPILNWRFYFPGNASRSELHTRSLNPSSDTIVNLFALTNSTSGYTQWPREVLVDTYPDEASVLAALESLRLQQITYRLTNCTAPDAPSEASIGSTVTVPFVFPDGYGIVNNENVYVTNNGVIVPSTYSGGVLTFEMPDPN